MHLLNDCEIDARAMRYSEEHGVNYSEAAARVVVLAELEAPLSASFAEAGDVALHVRAMRYSAEHGVNYSEAIEKVSRDATAVGYSETVSDRHIGRLDAAQALQGQSIEIFRAGAHTDSAGVARTFTVHDVMAMAAAYNPAKHEAPLTLGHPEADRPAYGWVKRLVASPSGVLSAYVDRVDPAFAESLKAGRFSKRSASFYPPNAPNNPTPGKWYLRHVGWLGAQPPAVQGLADIRFGMAADDGAVLFL